MRQTAAGRWTVWTLRWAMFAVWAAGACHPATAQESAADDIFASPPTTANPPVPSTDVTVPTDVPPTTVPSTTPSTTPTPGLGDPAAAPVDPKDLPDIVQDIPGREVNPQAKQRLQQAFIEFRSQQPDFKKVIDMAREAIQIQVQAYGPRGNTLIEAFELIGASYAQLEDYEGMAAAYDAVSKLNPNDVRALTLLGQAYFELKEYSLAVEALTQALNLDSQQPVPLYWRGKARTEQHDYQAAIEDLQEAARANRNDKAVYTALGKVQLLLGDADSAKASLDRAVKLDAATPADQKSTFAEAYFERGKLFATLGSLEKAVADLSIAVERDGQNREYLMNLGALQHEVAVVDKDPSKLTLAIEAFNRAAAVPKKPEEEKEDVSPYVAKARTYVQMGNMETDKTAATDAYREAVAMCNKAIDIEPKAPMAFYQRGVAQRMLENFDAAIASFSEAIRLSPSFASALYRRGIVWYHRGEYRLAGQDFDEALRAEPGNPKYLVWRGLAYAQQEKYLDAIESYTQALRTDPQNVRAYHNRALAFLAIGEAEKAVGDFNQAIRLNARDEQAYYRRGVALDRMGESDRAIESISTALELKSDYVDALIARGKLYQRHGDATKAAADFAAAKKLGAAQ